MCGICGFIGHNGKAIKNTLDGIGALEHRGYDSMGVAFLLDDVIDITKISQEEAGQFSIKDLKQKVKDINRECNIGIGHTRWATYGGVNIQNAHPHIDSQKRICVVHNGNILNFDELKKELDGYNFYSETDTEIIAHLINKAYSDSKNLVDAVCFTLKKISGANAFVVMSLLDPSMLIAANKGGTILLGKNQEYTIVASDLFAFERLGIKDNHSLGDNQVALIRSDGWEIIDVNVNQSPEEKIKLDGSIGAYRHFMEKEIFEQPKILINAIRGRLRINGGIPKLGGVEEVSRFLRKADRFHFIGCGTAYNACCYGALLFNRFGIDAKAWIASEFMYSHPVIEPNDVFVFISQSGETADTIEVLNEIKVKRNLCLGIVNVEGSRIARDTNAGIYIRSGKEKGVASTKAFTSQLITVIMLAVFLARQRRMTIDTGEKIIQEIFLIPPKVGHILNEAEKVRVIASKYVNFKNYYFLGRCFSSIVAQEGALKLKEISYVHAESYPLGEMKHGPLALIDEDFCSVVIIPKDFVFKHSLANVREIKARKGPVIAITDADDLEIADDVIKVPTTIEYLSPLITTIPLQLFAYFTALELGLNPDKPRNLAKTVTVN